MHLFRNRWKTNMGYFLKIELWDPCALDAFITISLFTFNAFCIINHESFYWFLPWFEDFWGKCRGGKHFLLPLVKKFIQNYFWPFILRFWSKNRQLQSKISAKWWKIISRRHNCHNTQIFARLISSMQSSSTLVDNFCI